MSIFMPPDVFNNSELPRITASDLPGGGVACPDCGCTHFYTTHTQRPVHGVTRRRKVCRHCGRSIVTYEQIRK